MRCGKVNCPRDGGCRFLQCVGDGRGGAFGGCGDLAVGEADDVVAQGAEVQVSVMVVLKGLRATVVAVAIGLDDDALLAPEEVDDARSNPHIDLRRRQPMALAEAQEEMLQLAPRLLAGALGSNSQPACPRLSYRAAKFGGRDDPPKVGNGLGRRRYGNAQPPGHGCCRQRGAAMEEDSGSLPSAGFRPNRHVHCAALRVQESPESSRAAMAEYGPPSAGQNRRRPSSLLRDTSMPDGVHTAMEAMKSPRAHTNQDRIVAQSGLL
jgi:hypothetical protein